MSIGDFPELQAACLSKQARAVWAKHDRDTEGWLPLWRHMADSGLVAGLLWDEWLPGQVRRLIATALPGGMDDARRLAVWLAAVHDIGKAAPAFACQVEALAVAMRDEGLAMPGEKRMPDRRLGPHGLAGQLLLQEWLTEHHGWARRATAQLAVVVGGHHGVPPSHSDISELRRHPALLRTPGAEDAWRAVQDELLDAAALACGVGDRLADWRDVQLPQPVQVLLTALVIVADWIASNPDLFPYFPDGLAGQERRIESAWRALDLPGPWTAVEPVGAPADLFAARFDLPPGARLRPVQEEAVRLARAMPAPGLMVIEAPMGEGKTEAALAAAEVFAARSGAGGCFVALPTMATGNAMFPRLLRWLDHLPDEHAGTGAHSVFLAHSKAALNEQYAGLMRGPVADIGRDGGGSEWHHRADTPAASAELVAHHWLRGRKKGMLSSFAVGTIDQLLFAGLKSRHLALRHLAVAGKVVVIDEAHAYDTYMNAYLDRVLSWLGAYRVPVVILSATLPAARRRELAAAYAGLADADPHAAEYAPIAEARGYPLITTVVRGAEPAISCPTASGRGTEVTLVRLSDDLDRLADLLADELAGGGCALVVRNTVDRAHAAAARLRESLPDTQVRIAHARFLDLDRADNDARLLADFGPPATVAAMKGERPERCVVVATQVAEQSLDVDFDLMVTDLAPIDLMLQRMGRLHRHERGEGQLGRPARLRAARCYVTGVDDWNGRPPMPVRGSRRVYQTYPLLRSLAVLDPYLTDLTETGAAGVPPVRLPDAISPLVQDAYGSEPVGPDEWHTETEKARRAYRHHRADQADRAQAFLLNGSGRDGSALVGWVDAGVGDVDDSRRGRAQVRDSKDTVEVLVVQRRADGALVTVPWLTEGRGGIELPTETAPPPRSARVVASCGLRLPWQFERSSVLDRAIAELEANYFPAWQTKESHWLAGELVLVLDSDCHTRLAGFQLDYSRSDGLKVIADD
ncbi:CRISPR-associated helicase Cas3' [Allonocardiopsis opalescens]|uniref:CRISPR-associated endonuclease/helicase Cas3 n=1 Tax=Allonocardiopsis opalescens TaxID=1144618 RepID=A0A2T0PV79_9ACTN|nr:CRISPR-associated helicase Cas3' [Allonocardiopsis opalescens]PRX95417.1 CRISPR-associated endonuclease/helicase Cas3 [Allonocardiopsis opalescens]